MTLTLTLSLTFVRDALDDSGVDAELLESLHERRLDVGVERLGAAAQDLDGALPRRAGPVRSDQPALVQHHVLRVVRCHHAPHACGHDRDKAVSVSSGPWVRRRIGAERLGGLDRTLTSMQRDKGRCGRGLEVFCKDSQNRTLADVGLSQG